MIYLLYAVVMFIASVTGALAGLGGGVIIKQLLDVIGYHNAVEIGFYTSVAIFVMGIVAIALIISKSLQFRRAQELVGVHALRAKKLANDLPSLGLKHPSAGKSRGDVQSQFMR